MTRHLWALAVLPTLFSLAHCGTDSGDTFPDGEGGSSGTSGASGTSGLIGGGTSGASGDGGGGGTGASGGPSCATAESGATRVPVYLDIILDGSRSMDGHGQKSSGCDSKYTNYDGDNCFLAGSREQDPLAPQRTDRVCHKESDGVDKCPDFKGLTGKKWIAIRGALKAFFEARAAQASPQLGVGMYLFESSQKRGPNDWDVSLGLVDAAHAGELWARIEPGTWPSGGTPLRDSIDGQAELLRAYAPAAPLATGGNRAILLITDGVPNGSSSDAEVVTSVQNARNGTPSVATAVIGVGNVDAPENNVYNEKFLSKLASEGGVAPAGCNPDWNGEAPNGTTSCHVQVTPGEKDAATLQAEFSTAIDAIALSLQSCELALTATSAIDPSKVNVVFQNGAGAETQVPADGTNGWTYDNPTAPTKVILNGAACDALKADPAAKVSIVVGCPTGTEVR